MVLTLPAILFHAVIMASFVQGVSLPLILAICHVESGFTFTAIGDNGKSYGIMQLHVEGAGYGVAPSLLLLPTVNVSIGTSYLRRCMNEFPDSLELAISAYNQGIAGAKKRGLDVNRAYVDHVLSLTDTYKEAILRVNHDPLSWGTKIEGSE